MTPIDGLIALALILGVCGAAIRRAREITRAGKKARQRGAGQASEQIERRYWRMRYPDNYWPGTGRRYGR